MRAVFRVPFVPAWLALACAPGPSRDHRDAGRHDAAADAEPDAEPEDCARLSLDLSAPLPDVMMLLDHSSSMLVGLGHPETPRWDVLLDAMLDPTTGLATSLAPHLTVGAAVYDAPSTDAGEDGPWCPVVNGVMPAPNNLEPIRELLGLVGTPVGGTPTAEALRSVVSGLVDGGEPPPGGRVLLLVTDLGASGCEGSGGGKEEAIAAAGDAFANGVRVHAFAFRVWDFPERDGLIYLQRLANAGAGLLPEGAENAPSYFASEPGDTRLELGRLLSTAARSCILGVEGTIDAAQAEQAAVYLAGTEVPYRDGWRVIDEHTIELLGTACEQLLAAREGTLQVGFPCEVF